MRYEFKNGIVTDSNQRKLCVIFVGGGVVVVVVRVCVWWLYFVGEDEEMECSGFNFGG